MSAKYEQMQKRLRELFEYIQSTDESNIPRLRAFSNFATKHKLKCETVRNLYYSAVKQYKLQDAFNIEKCKHFKECELKLVMSRLVNEINRTKSVRQACYNLSNGDAKQMLRLQNKYRSIMKNNPEFLYNLGLKCDNKTAQNCKKIANESDKFNAQKTLENTQKFINENATKCSGICGIPAKNDNNSAKFSNKPAKNSKLIKNNILPLNDLPNGNICAPQNASLKSEGTLCKIQPKESDAKILRMPKSQALTDDDISNLFMGLVKMVKRSAIENAPKSLRDECFLANENLKQTLARLGANTKKLEIIKCENQLLKQKLDESQKLLEKSRSEFVELINKIDQTGHIEELKFFLKSYKLCDTKTKLNER